MNKKKNNSIFIDLFFVLLCLACLLPFVLLLSISLTSERDLVKFGYKLIPNKIDFTAYKYLFKDPTNIINSYGFTAFTSFLGTGFGLLVMILCAYPLSIRTFKYRGFFSKYLFVTMIFSGGMAATYIINTRYLHLANTPWVFILPTAVGAWNIFLLRSFFQGLSGELVEAAKIDGAGHYRILFSIIVPLSKPAIATVALFVLLQHWNDWYTCLLYITNSKMFTVQYLLQTMMDNITFAQQMQEAGIQVDTSMIPTEAIRMGMAVIAAGPMIIVFPFFQKYFTKGITIGSVKG